MSHSLALARRFPVKKLIPLLLSVAVCQAYAAEHGANGATDHRTLTLTNAGNLSANLSATGGNGDNGTQSGGNGGAASAVLDLTAAWHATGNVSAYGGNGGTPAPENATTGGYGTGGDATATGVLRGSGATGSAYAQGGSYSKLVAGVPNAGNANSSLTAWTTGAQAVALSSSAYAGQGGGTSTANLYVDSGVSRPAAGTADVTGSVSAIGNNAYTPGNSIATLTLLGTGKLTGTSLAQTGSTYEEPFMEVSPAALAQSIVQGATSGKHDVTLSSTAKGGYVPIYGGGGASAMVSGQSGSGKVSVTADASAPFQSFGSGGGADAHAVARTTAQGGSSYAQASASGDSLRALAEAYSVGSGGSKAVAIGSGGVTGGDVVARSTATDGGSRLLVATSTSSAAEAAVTTSSEAAFGGLSVALPTIGGDQRSVSVVTAGGSAGLGAGMQLGVGPNIGYSVNEGQHIWQQSAAADHLWINFLDSASGPVAFYSLDLYISNNGQTLYEGSFTSVAEADLFFKGHTLDLGPLTAGAQNFSIRSDMTGATGSYAFNYILAVPEPTTWLLLLSGLTLVMVAARRKSKAGLQAPDLLHAKAC